MAQEITIELFERNAKIYNKKGLRRQYYSIPEKNKEYSQRQICHGKAAINAPGKRINEQATE